MREKSVCFTGHRDIPLPLRPRIASALRENLSQLIAQDYCHFYAGGALGFDTMAAEAILALREAFPQIQLILTLPYPDQARGWEEADRARYEAIKGHADTVIYTAEQYTRGCMHRRNRFMVDHSHVCLYYLRENRGGTYYTVQYAKKHGLHLIPILP